MTLSTPDTQSVSDIEKGDSYTEKDNVKDELQFNSQDAESGRLPAAAGSKEKDIPSPTVNVSDWNGPDDPDNPHNCL
jgi:hypothetical protein